MVSQRHLEPPPSPRSFTDTALRQIMASSSAVEPVTRPSSRAGSIRNRSSSPRPTTPEAQSSAHAWSASNGDTIEFGSVVVEFGDNVATTKEDQAIPGDRIQNGVACSSMSSPENTDPQSADEATVEGDSDCDDKENSPSVVPCSPLDVADWLYERKCVM